MLIVLLLMKVVNLWMAAIVLLITTPMLVMKFPSVRVATNGQPNLFVQDVETSGTAVEIVRCVIYCAHALY